MLRAALNIISTQYLLEKDNPFGGNEFGSYVRGDVKSIVEGLVGREDLAIKCSVGTGNWAEILWIGFFNQQITTSATEGVYVVYLFSADMRELYLCLGQGVTKVKEEFGKNQRSELLRRGELIRSRAPEYRNDFEAGPIQLRGLTNLAKEYDDAVSFYARYETDNLPNEDAILYDLTKMLALYDHVIERGGTDNIETFTSFSLDDEITIEEKRVYVRHSRIERNTKAAKQAKKSKPALCESCGFDFKEIYGERGEGYIEAHHLIPLHSLPIGKPVSMDPKSDFALLCSNCHKMVHRKMPMLTLKQLKELPGVQLMNGLFKK